MEGGEYRSRVQLAPSAPGKPPAAALPGQGARTLDGEAQPPVAMSACSADSGNSIGAKMEVR
jgi:hypothetical protein